MELRPEVVARAAQGDPGAGAPSDQVETALFRALIVVRLVVTVYAVVLNLVRVDEFERPVAAVASVAVLVAWSAYVSWAYDTPRRRRAWLYAADLTVAVLLILITPLVQSGAMLERHASTVPSFWVMAPVLAWAVGWGWVAGTAAATVVSLADISVRDHVLGATWGNIFLLVLAAGVVGYTAGLLRDAAELRAAAERAAAASEERTRLSRAVHDGVLQVLALVQRRGAAAGGDLADLARLAGEQEAALRSLIQLDARTRDSAQRSSPSGDTVDLMASLEAMQSPRVTVAGPVGAVSLPAYDAQELTAVVAACLDNVRVHVGEDAPAWVFVEDLGAQVVVTVRDEGPGIPGGRLEEAAGQGRLGVVSSIRGRMTDLGGTAELTTGAGLGTEWELVLPRG